MGEPSVKRVAALLRVSTEKVEQSESPEAQLLFIREELRRHSQGEEVWLDTTLVYQDELTGAMVLDRPGVKRLLADAQAKKFDLVAMKSIQRLGRDTLGLLHLKRLLDDANIELVALQDGYRSGRDPELIFLVHADRAQAGRVDISRNVRNAMRQRAKQGRWMSGNVPFGYRRKNRHELEPHPETAPIVQEIFRFRRMGWGATRIIAHLNTSKVPAPAWWEAKDRLDKLETLAATDDRYQSRLKECRLTIDRRPSWNPKTLRVIFDNTAYYGELVYNRSFWRVKTGGHKVLETRDPDEWITVPCPPLVTRQEWAEAQQVISRNRRAKIRDGGDTHVYLLTGLLECGRCGARMNGGGGRVGPYGFYAYYHCQAKRDQRTCDQPSPRADSVEDALFTILPEALSQVPEETVDRKSSHDGAKVRLQQLEAKLADLADEKRYLRNEHRRERISDAELDESLARVQAEEGPLRAELSRVRDEILLPDLAKRSGEIRQEVREQIARYLLNPKEFPRQQVRAWIHSVVDRVVFRSLDDFDLYLKLSKP